MTVPRSILEAATSALSFGTPAAIAEAAPLLDLLGWSPSEGGAVKTDRIRLLRGSLLCLRVFRLAAPDAPGLEVFGAELDLAAIAGEPGLPVVGTSGVGVVPGAAFAACVAEAAELVAQVETAAQRALREAAGSGEVMLRRWPDGAACGLPLDRCMRRAPGKVARPAPVPLSVGCAAGRTDAEAKLHAALELVERDAVGLWWEGGHAPRPVSLEVGAAAADLLAHLRRDAAGRRSWLLDITSDLGVPCIAAVSLGADGRGFCCGTASRATLAEAACSAILELCQNEMGVAVVHAKATERGTAALNARDVAMLRRWTDVRADGSWLIEPVGAPREAGLRGHTPKECFEAIGERLVARGFTLLLLDHEGPAGLPVWRTVCEDLACEPSRLRGARLDAAIARTGGGPGIRHSLTIHGLVSN